MIFSNTEKSILGTLLKSKKINEHKIYMRALGLGLLNSGISASLLSHLRQKNYSAVKEFFEAVVLDFPENKKQPAKQQKISEEDTKKEVQKEPYKQNSKERVKKHRFKKRKNGFKTISFDLDRETYEKLNKIKSEANMSYSELFTKLISC